MRSREHRWRTPHRPRHRFAAGKFKKSFLRSTSLRSLRSEVFLPSIMSTVPRPGASKILDYLGLLCCPPEALKRPLSHKSKPVGFSENMIGTSRPITSSVFRCPPQCALIAKWKPLIGVNVARFYAQRMKSKWGSCRAESRSIRLNTDLAQKPPQCLEYIVVHELVHLLEPTHNDRFTSLMDQFMPHWRFCRAELNRWPLRHENWVY